MFKKSKEKVKEKYVYGVNSFWKDLWYFIWEDNSFWSWIVNILLAFVIIKFLVYHDLSGTNICGKFPLEYRSNLDGFWNVCGDFYEERGIIKDEFSNFPLSNGFKKGDIIILYGKDKIEVGDVLVFWAQNPSLKRDPIIHRVIDIKNDVNGNVYTTKGDHNPSSIQDEVINEMSITENRVIGTALFKIPFLGYIKIFAVSLVGLLFGMFY